MLLYILFKINFMRQGTVRCKFNRLRTGMSVKHEIKFSRQKNILGIPTLIKCQCDNAL